MKKGSLNTWVRILLLLCAAALVAVLFVPMWSIDLVAPQYPEGLRLLIYPDKLSGNVDIINGLNHYIGMKTLHTEDFFEFKILPYLVGFFAAAFIAAAAIGKKIYLNVLVVLFVCFGILAMYDFWRWEYNYGHNLNPDAAIIVPGMAYQPPLIGFKQLLNFGAYSFPDIGGWLFAGVGGLLVLCWAISTWQLKRQRETLKHVFIFTIVCAALSSCRQGPEPLQTGTDQCYFCKMTLSDPRFGAEIITKKGKAYKFDDVHCILGYLGTKDLAPEQIKDIYLADCCGTHQLINVKQALLLKSERLRSPMEGNVAAFKNADSLKKTQEKFPGQLVKWEELYTP